MSIPSSLRASVRVELPPSSRQNIYVYIQDQRTGDREHYNKNYHKRIVFSLGAALIGLAIAAIIAQVFILLVSLLPCFQLKTGQ
jgi:hypothetical protein